MKIALNKLFQKKENQKLTTDYIYFFLASTIPAGLGFVIAIFLSKTISLEDYGYLGIFALILYIFEPLVFFFNIGLLEIKYINYDKLSYLVYKDKYITFGLTNLIIFFSVFFVFSVFFEKYRLLFIFIPLFTFTRFFLKIIWMELIQDKNAKVYSLSFLLLSFIMFFLTIVFVSFFEFNWKGRLGAMLVPEFLLIFFFYRNHTFRIKWFNRQEQKEVFKYGFPLFISLGAAWILQEVDKSIVLKFFDLSSVGVYTFAYLIGRVVRIINMPIIQIMKPIYYNKLKTGKLTQRTHLNNIVYFIISVFPIVFGLNILVVYLMPFLPDAYHKGVDVIQIVTYAFAFFGLYQISFIVLDYHKLNMLKTIILYFAAFLNIVFSVVMIDQLGLLAPAYGTLLGFVVIAIIGIYYSFKHL